MIKMEKKIIFIILFLSLIFISKCEDNSPEENMEDNEDNEEYAYDDYDGEKYFKESLKQYLIEKKLFDSERPVKRDEMKKIFLDVITEGDQENTPEYLNGIFEDLTEYFVNTYYKDRSEIRGNQIYDLIDINLISMKFEQMMGNNPYYGMEEEEKVFDSRDAVGEPNPDI